MTSGNLHYRRLARDCAHGVLHDDRVNSRVTEACRGDRQRGVGRVLEWLCRPCAIGNSKVQVPPAKTFRVRSAPTSTVWLCGWAVMLGGVITVRSAAVLVILPALLETTTV